MTWSWRRKSVSPGPNFCSITTGMTKPARSVAEFRNSEAAVAVIHTKECHTLKPKFGVDVARERVALEAVVLNHGEVPGDDGLGDRGIGGCAVDQGCFRLQREAKSDVRRFGADGSEHRPDFVVVNHSDGVVRGCAPYRGIS